MCMCMLWPESGLRRTNGDLLSKLPPGVRRRGRRRDLQVCGIELGVFVWARCVWESESVHHIISELVMSVLLEIKYLNLYKLTDRAFEPMIGSFDFRENSDESYTPETSYRDLISNV